MIQFSGRLWLLAAVLLGASLASASPLQDEISKHVPQTLIRRDGNMTEEQMANITDPAKQCETPLAQGMDQLLKRNVFPKLYEVASILPGDGKAQSMWDTIQKSGIIPSSVNVKKDTTNGQRTYYARKAYIRPWRGQGRL